MRKLQWSKRCPWSGVEGGGAEECGEEGVPNRDGGVSLDRAGHLGIQGFAAYNYFWFVANPVASKCLDGNAPRLSPHFAVTTDNSSPFLHASTCLMVNLAPQPLQHLGKSNNSNPYCLLIASLHLYFDRDMPLTKVGWMDIQVPVSVLRVDWQVLKGIIRAMRVNMLAVALACLEAWAALLPSRIAFWWLVMASGVPSRRDLVRTAVHTLKVVWLSLADLMELGTPTPADLTGRERRVQRSRGMVVGVIPPRRVGRNAVQMAVSIGANCSGTSDTTRCRYCYSCW